jgi:hypothetical protein
MPRKTSPPNKEGGWGKKEAKMEREIIFVKDGSLPEIKQLEESMVVNLVFKRTVEVSTGTHILRGLLLENGDEIISMIKIDKIDKIDKAVSAIDGVVLARLESNIRSDVVRITGDFGQYYPYVADVILKLHKSY